MRRATARHLHFADAVKLRDAVADLDEPLEHLDLGDTFANVGEIERHNFAQRRRRVQHAQRWRNAHIASRNDDTRCTRHAR